MPIPKNLSRKLFSPDMAFNTSYTIVKSDQVDPLFPQGAKVHINPYQQYKQIL
jgi:hypothetical protein